MRNSLKILLATMILIPFVISCENRYHISPEDIEAGAYWGTEGVMPTIGFVYKESVNVLDIPNVQEASLPYAFESVKSKSMSGISSSRISYYLQMFH